MGVLPSQNRPTEFYILVPGSTLYFDSRETANQCADAYREQSAQVRTHIDILSSLGRTLDQRKANFAKAQSDKLNPITSEKDRLSQEAASLQRLKTALIERATMEKVYGSSPQKLAADPLPAVQTAVLAPDKPVPNNSETSQNNWTTIFQTNATRYGALAIVFFLVGFLSLSTGIISVLLAFISPALI